MQKKMSAACAKQKIQIVDFRFGATCCNVFQDIVDRSRFREDNLAGSLKLRKANLDKRRADYELAVSEEKDDSKQKELLALADENRKEVAEATLAFQAANTHRKTTC